VVAVFAVVPWESGVVVCCFGERTSSRKHFVGCGTARGIVIRDVIDAVYQGYRKERVWVSSKRPYPVPRKDSFRSCPYSISQCHHHTHRSSSPRYPWIPLSPGLRCHRLVSDAHLIRPASSRGADTLRRRDIGNIRRSHKASGLGHRRRRGDRRLGDLIRLGAVDLARLAVSQSVSDSNAESHS